ncbi:MAG: flippase-like domain-containing protein [Acidobacteria bacterium]|nr:flippase-like domain-containing protein [Acidobacteriota bacterium]
MNQIAQNKNAGRRFTPLGIVFAILGLLLFSYFVKSAGWREILDGITRLGAGFVLVLAISGLRPVVRSLAWTRCFEAPYQLRFRDALWAYLIGDAVGTLVPLGIIVSEPTKAAMVRKRVPLMAGLSALAIENLFYSLSVALFIFAGMAALLFSFQLNKTLRIISISALGVVVVLIALAFIIIRRQWKFTSGALEYLYGRGIGRALLETRRERVRSLEDRVYGFYTRNHSRFLPIMLLEACFHLSGVLEVYVVLYFINDTFTGSTSSLLLAAFVLESVNRIINVVFKFVPLRLGVDEAGSGWITNVLRLGKASGVTLAIIRKARIICWTALGVALLVRRGLSLRDVAEESQAAVAREIAAAPIVPASESG